MKSKLFKFNVNKLVSFILNIQKVLKTWHEAEVLTLIPYWCLVNGIYNYEILLYKYH